MNLKQSKAFQTVSQLFNVSPNDLEALVRTERHPETRAKMWLYLIGCVLTPITLIGALIGYVKGYRKFMFPKREPELNDLSPIMRLAMMIGAVTIWVILIGVFVVLYFIAVTFFGSELEVMFLFLYLITNLILCFTVFVAFNHWKVGIIKHIFEQSRFGTARFAEEKELQPFKNRSGFYIGEDYYFSDKGHLLTTAGTRSGKFTNLVAPNLLGRGGYNGSWVVVDPKGEATAVTARYQRESGKNVVVLNPWGQHEDVIGQSQSYNPLDILMDKSSIHLVDDAGMIAEMIIPVDKADKDKFFSDNARAILTGLLLHLVTSQKKEAILLRTLWEWVRLPKKQWETLLEDMAVNDDPINGDVVKKAGHEIMKLMSSGERTFGIIMAYMLQATDFIKSPSLQKSLETGFDPKTLSDGNTIIYIIIPADKLVSHFRWLRLIITTTMRAVVRNPNERVCFLLDEFAALGYMTEIETALSTYAGYNITVWPILQSLIQLQSLYGENWETFIGNTAVRHFFGVNDNFTAEYVSKAIGLASHVEVIRDWFKIKNIQANSRSLVTADEVMRGSGTNIFTFIQSLPVTTFKKEAYYEMSEVLNNGKPRFDENPFFKKKK